VKLNYLLWSHLPPAVTGLMAMRRYGSFLHRLVLLGVRRQQNFGTFFLRNRPLLALIRSLAQRHETGSTLTMAFIGCSNGAELYSVLWTIRSARPDLKIVAHAVDISKEILAIAERGTYSLTAAELAPARIFERMTEAEWTREGMHSESGRYTVERWLEIYAEHAHNHADQIRRARAAPK